jgi:hypothetical protein
MGKFQTQNLVKCSSIEKKIKKNGKKSCFWAIFSNFAVEAGVVDLKISKSSRTKVVSNDV